MRIGFLLFILGLSVTASAQMYRVAAAGKKPFYWKKMLFRPAKFLSAETDAAT